MLLIADSEDPSVVSTPPLAFRMSYTSTHASNQEKLNQKHRTSQIVRVAVHSVVARALRLSEVEATFTSIRPFLVPASNA
jgi:hypothetical protein